jgi:hypothetical protein
MPLADWKPIHSRKNEDQLLLKYWQELGGIIFTEVIVGRGGLLQWANGAKPRRIDAVRIISPLAKELPSDIFTFNKLKNAQRFQQMVSGVEVEVIEVKHSLDRVVLGQVIIGSDLLEMEYSPFQIKQVVICEVGDPVLEVVCKKRDIKVWIHANG